MSERDSSRDGIERRGVLAALATGVGGVGLARSSFARETGTLDATQYVVEQGDRCVPITPLSGDETVESFYDYRTPHTAPSGEAYSSYGTTDLQRPETSVCFLYDGPEGLSLVVVHDKLNDGTSGGAVTFDLRVATPGTTAWVVGDDDYDAPTNYDEFTRTDAGWTVDWTWASGRSDGGALRPLGDDFTVTIDPRFNENAALYGNPYEGELTEWQVLSGDRSDPDRFSLAMDQPLTIRAGTCGAATTTATRTETTEETTTEETTEDADEEQSSDPIHAELEILPGKVNPRSHGRLPVVVRSTDEFDATRVARGSVEFGPSAAGPVKRIRTDADGRADLKLHFRLDATGIDWDTDEVELTGETESGREVVCVADVELVPRGDGDDNEEDENGDRDEGDGDDEDGDSKHGEDGDGEKEAERKEDDERAEDHDESGGEESDEDGAEDTESDHGRGNGKGHGGGKGHGNGNGHGNDDNPGRGRGRGKGRDGDD
ncbi:hypothetical protein M0R89_11175 [Halorussus limi]|uniref:Uncharacterized protein n=1 Tax=Halorussus limi TaxID=2938695 RepID=A0A8U0HQ80_9EURY|nr:hypothetical protein [Halorussus limi]UPV73110.1 hypothetical protein M0R89_11175 [Halorussus limi]